MVLVRIQDQNGLLMNDPCENVGSEKSPDKWYWLKYRIREASR
jgi:hypothetical protein